MSFNLTFIGQSIAFFVFWWFCQAKVWPLFANILEQRKQKIADGLEAGARGEKDLELAQARVIKQLKEVKAQAVTIIDQANKRGSQIVDEAKDQAREEGQRIIAGAKAEIEQEVNRAKESLREQVSAIAIAGAEKILESSIDQAANEEMLSKLAAEL
ncbi:MAG TPA: F0F1 ATP synthase subunit B [Gammaproteobacteria bacterium]|jgi:F-type H+-transporting ATPase subunit b|nr:F0F1 ATP synthase subunit B [Gammaproteobacteria bacterium]HIL62309.1 F0F1 ATP synthase subunit B [Porticoccaceae bacterium]HIN89089.1 F0F1 ATP synthase subunit B [Porticoccaceae bacterium]|tara:strand:- start:8409 stop:8879 length:471 start_codon:yes stop_codon:yes gene_type:complete